jgi:hypothetical protein
MTRGTVEAAGAALLAFLATHHHALMMALLLAGIGGAAGTSVMDSVPAVRWAMVLMSAVMVGLAIVRVWRHRHSPVARYVGGASAVLAVGVLAWSIAEIGG